MERVASMFKNRCKLGLAANGAKRLVVGDVHGQYNALMTLLECCSFDPAKDSLIFVGDLIDRGPDSFKCAKLLKLPYVSSCVGNHELMSLEAYMSNSAQLVQFWQRNGGNWFYTLTTQQQHEVIKLFLTRLFWTIEFNWKQFTIGVVHSDIPAMADWGDFDNGITIPNSVQKYMVWSRHRIHTQNNNNALGIDFTVSGHTITNEMVKLGNTLSIDTGAAMMNNSEQGKLSVLEFSDDVILRSINSTGDVKTSKVKMF